MPTQHPRIALTIKSDLKKVYDDTADLMGIPTTSLIMQILSGAGPHVRKMGGVLAEAREKPIKSLSELADLVQELRVDAVGHQVDIEDEIARLKNKKKGNVKKSAKK